MDLKQLHVQLYTLLFSSSSLTSPFAFFFSCNDHITSPFLEASEFQKTVLPNFYTQADWQRKSYNEGDTPSSHFGISIYIKKVK